MIDLYYWHSEASLAVLMALEELDYRYNIIPINSLKATELDFEFLNINPLATLPVLVAYDDKNIKEKRQNQKVLLRPHKMLRFLLGSYSESKSKNELCLDQIDWIHKNIEVLVKNAQDKPVGSISCQLIKKKFLYLDDHFSSHKFLCGKFFTISDTFLYPYIHNYERYNLNINDYPHLKEWYYRIYNRTKVRKAQKISTHFSDKSFFTESQKHYILNQNPNRKDSGQKSI